MTEEKKEPTQQEAQPADEILPTQAQADNAGQPQQKEQQEPEAGVGSGQDSQEAPATGDVQNGANKEKAIQENTEPATGQQKPEPAEKQQKQENTEGQVQEQSKAEETNEKSTPKPEAAVGTGKRKKINLMSLKELDDKLKSVKDKMGNLRSRYARQLLKQKEVINKQNQ
jgi:hypothetical protein